jgi:hypothetical protein
MQEDFGGLKNFFLDGKRGLYVKGLTIQQKIIN